MKQANVNYNIDTRDKSLRENEVVMEGRRSPRKHKDSDVVENQFNTLRDTLSRIADLPGAYEKTAREHGIETDQNLLEILRNIREECRRLIQISRDDNHEKNYANLKTMLADILRHYINTFSRVLAIEDAGDIIHSGAAEDLVNRISLNKRRYLASRLMGLILHDLQLDMSFKRLPEKKELVKILFGKYPLTKDKNRFEYYYILANKMYSKQSRSELLRSLLDKIIKQLFDATSILGLELGVDDKKNKDEFERFVKLYKDCLAAYLGEDGVTRDALGKLARIVKLISDEFAVSCGITEPASTPATSSPHPERSPGMRSSESPSLTRSGSFSKLSGSASRIPQLIRSASFKRSGSQSNLFQMKGKTLGELADLINHNPDKYHYARLLGLILGDIYRNKDAPKFTEKEMHEIQNQLALLIELPNRELYSTLSFAVDPPGQNRGYNPPK